MKRLFTKTLVLSIACMYFSTNWGEAQNIFSGEPVQVVGQMQGYSTTAGANSVYRRMTVTTGTPIDGRGQWVKTYNVQASGGDFVPINMAGGGSNGFLLISGPASGGSCGGRYNNRWVFGGVAQATLNTVNATNYSNSCAGTDMGLNMSTAGRYTFVFNDVGYTGTNALYYVARTDNAPVTMSRTQTLNLDRTATINITTSATPSPQENIFVRYTTATDFSTGNTSSIVQATGSGTAWSATIPAQTVTSTVRYYVFTSTRSLVQLNGDSELNRSLATLNFDDNSGNNYSYNYTVTSVATGNLSAAGSWDKTPFDGGIFIIANTHAITLDANKTVYSLTVNSGGTFNGSSNTLSIASGGSLTLNAGGVFNAGTGTISCLGNATLASTSYNNITAAGSVAMSGTTTINGNLQINDGGTISGSAPTYGASSTLIYNRTNGSNYTITGSTVEWTGNGTTAGVGIPQNVTLSNASGSGSFTLNLPNSNRGIAGNLSIGANSIFACNGTSGDFYIAGNFTNNGTFTDNNRAIFFNGTAEQTVSGTNDPAFAYMIINKSGSNVKLARSLTVEGSGAGGNVFEINNAGGLDLNDNTLTFINNNVNDIRIAGGTRTISNSGSGTGVFEILSTGNVTPNQTDLIVASSGVLNIGTKVKLSLRGTGSGVGFSIFNLPANALTFTGDFELNTRGGLTGTNAPIYNSGSILRYNSGGSYDRNLEWSATTGAGYPQNIEIVNNTNFNLGANSGTGTARQIAGNLTIGTGSRLDMNTTNTMTQALTVKGNFTNNGTFDVSSNAGGKLLVEGNFIQAGTLTANGNDVRLTGSANQDLQIDASTTFFGLDIRKTGGNVTLKGTQASLNVSDVLELSDASNANSTKLDMNGKNILLGGTGSLDEDLTNNKIILDNTATTESNQGGYIEFTRTVNATITELAGSGLTIFRTGGSDYSVTVRRSHYTPSGNIIATGNKGIRKIYKITGTPTGTTDIRIKYADDEKGLVVSPDMMYRWSSTDGWKKANEAPANMTVSTVSNEIRATGIIASFSDWTVGANTLPLPITLVSFTAEKIRDTKALLTWKTASEINNTGFEVEKSLDGQNFEKIGFVNGAGNSQNAQTYTFTDENLTTSAYYRLRQIDIDGKFEYSPVVFVENDRLNIYPNPASADLFVEVGKENVNLPARLLNAQGVEVWKGVLASPTNQLDVSNLPKGVYFLNLVKGGKKIVEKIIVK